MKVSFIQYSTLTSGTITCTTTGRDIHVVHNAASLAATLTIEFPTPVDGQKVFISSSLGVTALTLASSKSFVGSITTIVAAGVACYVYSKQSDKWHRCI